MAKTLSLAEFSQIAKAAQARVAERGPAYYGWVNAPERTGRIFTQTQGWGQSAKKVKASPVEALEIYKKKLDGAYGERFVMSLGLIASLIANGYSVRFVQFQKEAGVPFNASGWTVIVVETMPIFHIAPEDLRLSDVQDLVEILTDNQAPDVAWKKTNKVGEFAALLAGSIEPGLDLVKIAQENS